MTRKNTINRVVKVLLPLFGIWPGRSSIIFFRVFWVASAAIIELSHYRFFVSHLRPEHFFDLVDCLCSFLAHGKVIAKIVLFWVNQRKLLEMLELMADDWKDSANNNDANMRVMMSRAKTSDRLTNTMIILHTVTIVMYCTAIVIADVDITDPTVDVIYINKLDLPFPVNTRGIYRFVLIVEYVHMVLSNWAAGITNSLILTLILHAGGQIDILESWLSRLVSEDFESEQESIARTARKIIQKHQKIINFSENIEIMYTQIALFLFASNTLLICSLGFLIVTAIGTPDAAEQISKCTLFYTTTNLETFIFCYAGEYLTNKSKTIGFAAYNSAWYNLKPKESRLLLLIIARAQKQITLTAGKMMDLNLESFTSIMNASGSYLSVMLAMQ